MRWWYIQGGREVVVTCDHHDGQEIRDRFGGPVAPADPRKVAEEWADGDGAEWIAHQEQGGCRICTTRAD